MYLLRRQPDYKTICAFVRLYSFGRKTHYEVLKLQKNCSNKEIKNAFIQMSKEYHPDLNKDVKAQETFIRIKEAYNVLGKPNSRAQYDSMMAYDDGSSSYVHKTHAPYTVRRNPQYSYYYEDQQKKQKQKERARTSSGPYYGFMGKKFPNVTIILACFGFAFAGLMLQLIIIRRSFELTRQTSVERSKRLGEELEKVRAKARENGNEIQTRLMMEKIVTGANPTVATANLGQALASDNKESMEAFLTKVGVPSKYRSYNMPPPADNIQVTYELLQKFISMLA